MIARGIWDFYSFLCSIKYKQLIASAAFRLISIAYNGNMFFPEHDWPRTLCPDPWQLQNSWVWWKQCLRQLQYTSSNRIWGVNSLKLQVSIESPLKNMKICISISKFVISIYHMFNAHNASMHWLLVFHSSGLWQCHDKCYYSNGHGYT